MEKMQKNADYYEKSADCAASIGKNMRYDTIFLMRTEKISCNIQKRYYMRIERTIKIIYKFFSKSFISCCLRSRSSI